MKYVIYYHEKYWDSRNKPFLMSKDQTNGSYGWLKDAETYEARPKIQYPTYDKVVTYEEALELEQQWRLRLELEAL